MLDNTPVSHAEIFAAANNLAAQGIMPSVLLVRKEIGRGSETTITRILREWKKELLIVYTDKEQIGEKYIKIVLENGQLERRLKEYDRVYKELKDSLLYDHMRLQDAPNQSL